MATRGDREVQVIWSTRKITESEADTLFRTNILSQGKLFKYFNDGFAAAFANEDPPRFRFHTIAEAADAIAHYNNQTFNGDTVIVRAYQPQIPDAPSPTDAHANSNANPLQKTNCDILIHGLPEKKDIKDSIKKWLLAKTIYTQRIPVPDPLEAWQTSLEGQPWLVRLRMPGQIVMHLKKGKPQDFDVIDASAKGVTTTKVTITKAMDIDGKTCYTKSRFTKLTCSGAIFELGASATGATGPSGMSNNSLRLVQADHYVAPKPKSKPTIVRGFYTPGPSSSNYPPAELPYVKKTPAGEADSDEEGDVPIPSQVRFSGQKFKDIKGKMQPRAAATAVPENAPSAALANAVYSNYVAITSWPEKLYEYTILYGEAGFLDSKGVRKTRKISRLQVKERILKAMKKLAPLAGKRYATDFEKIWSLDPLWGGDKALFELGAVEFKRPDGRIEIEGPPMCLRFDYEYTLPAKDTAVTTSPFSLTNVSRAQHAGILNGLNALITSNVKSTKKSEMFLAGTNKFFPLSSFGPLGPFLVARGFCTSVRPTDNRLLLNILPDTSAFYTPYRLCDALYYLWEDRNTRCMDKEDAMKTLAGVRCRLMYERPRNDPEGPNPNLESNRLKTVLEFGLPTKPRHGKGGQRYLYKRKGEPEQRGFVRDHFRGMARYTAPL